MSNIMLQCLLGIQCRDFVMVAADKINGQGFIVINNDEKKILQISKNLVVGVNGDAGQAEQFGQFIAKNMDLYKMRNHYELTSSSLVHFIRHNMVEALRGTLPYTLNLIVGSYDEECGSQMYYMDYLASCIKVPYACHGYGGYLSLGILDRLYKPDLSEVEGYSLLKECVREISERYLLNLPSFEIILINRHGPKRLPVINSSTLDVKLEQL